MMNRTQAKARAAELGISKDFARQFGNLTKTQTWLDALAAHEAQLPTVTTVEAPPVIDIQTQPDVQEQPATVEPVMNVAEDVDTNLERDVWSSQPELLSPVTATAIATASAAQTPKAAEASQPLVADPWDDLEELPEPTSQTSPANQSEPTALVYPVLLFLVLAWATCQLLLGLGSLMTLGLSHLASRADHAASVRLEKLRTPRSESSSATAAWPGLRGVRAAELQA